nr:putative cysteine-rich receptor-like protein kinase 35 [Quercus suber]
MVYCFRRMKLKQKRKATEEDGNKHFNSSNTLSPMTLKQKYKVKEEDAAMEITVVECLIFDFATLKAATNNFSDDKKLGRGGFGEVYKGSSIERPTMALIVLMLNSNSLTLPARQRPAFFLYSTTETNMSTKELASDQSTRKGMPSSVNEASITEAYPR